MTVMYAWLTRLNDSPPLSHSVCAVALSVGLSRAERAAPASRLILRSSTTLPLLAYYLSLSLSLSPSECCSLSLCFAYCCGLLLFLQLLRSLAVLAWITAHSYTALLIQRAQLSGSSAVCAKQMLLARIRAWILHDDFASNRHFSLKRHIETAFAWASEAAYSSCIYLLKLKFCNMSQIMCFSKHIHTYICIYWVIYILIWICIANRS